MTSDKPSVIVVRGHQSTPWELAMWEGVSESFDVRFLLTSQNGWDLGRTRLPAIKVRTLGSLLPRGQLSRFILSITNDRYLGLEKHLAGADIVHAEELCTWFAAQASELRATNSCHFRLAQTVWETIPLLHTYRHFHARHYRRAVLAHTDLFLPTTERAKHALQLEGVPPERIRVCPPGVNRARFEGPEPPEAASAREHVILSIGRLVWEKGHQDVMRAVAAIHKGVISGKASTSPRLLIIGDGPERDRLLAHARDLGIADRVEIRSVPYADMPSVYRGADALVLASLPTAMKPYHLLDRPRVFWEEQFGMVLAEAMIAGLPVVASRSGAIPEVLAGKGRLFDPGDWMQLAHQLVEGPLAEPVGHRIDYDEAFLHGLSCDRAAEDLCSAYHHLLETPKQSE